MSQHAVECFLAVAEEYCRFVESRSDYKRVALCRRALELIAQLVSLGAQLPSVEPDTIEPPRSSISHGEWSDIFSDLVGQLESVDGYWMVFDPYDPNEHDSIMSSLADDVADIYRDLKDSLPPSGRAPTNDELWSLKFSFETHWGQHAVSALTALHGLLYGPHSITD
jgi:hypothetical protein